MDAITVTLSAPAALPEMVRQVLHAAPAPLTFAQVKTALKKAGVKTGKGKVSDTEIQRELEAPEVHTHPEAAGKGKPKYWHRPPKSAAERVAEGVRAKVAALGGDPVPTSKLGKPGGKKAIPEESAAFERAVRELVAEGTLYEHPGGKYGKEPPPALADLVRKEVSTKLAEKEGPFKPADLSKPRRGAGDGDRQAHADALGTVIAELVAAKKLFPHSGGKFGQLPETSLADGIRGAVAAKLSGLDGSFRAQDLSQPRTGANKREKKAHAAALDLIVAELVAQGRLFHHPSGRLGTRAFAYPDHEIREVYILHQFFRAPNHTIATADIELAFPGKGKPEKKRLDSEYPHVARFRGQGCFEMGAPATRQALEQLAATGDLRVDERGLAYTLTDAGAERLKRSRAPYPVLPPVGDPAIPDDDAMREKWEAFVLLKLGEAPGFTLGESAVFVGGYPKGSKLNEATAWVLYSELAKAGYLSAKWTGCEGAYTLTPAGLRHLAGLSFDGFEKLEIRGPALTALLAAARGGPATAPSPPAAHSPPAAELEGAVMDTFHRLLRERHANDTRVPIHEVRAEVAKEHGPEAASHSVFDSVLNDLRRAGRTRLVAIDDLSQATEEQLRNSIKAPAGTLYYMKRIENAPA